jgi:FKBP-type peptidyl-prolyl cis-trans isomerase FkpA
MIRLTLAVLLALPLAARAQAPKTDDEKTLYAIGYLTGGRVQFLQLKPTELKIVEQGFHDGAAGAKAKVEPEERQEAINKLVQARTNAAADKEKGASKDFLAKAAQEKGAQKTPSGLVIKVVRPGNGPSPKETDKVKVNYEGRLINGTVFDSSYKRGQPAEFPLNGVIKCWTEGVQKMHVGEEATLVCPSDTAYGNVGHPPTIPGGATLVFKVELLGIDGGAGASTAK